MIDHVIYVCYFSQFYRLEKLTMLIGHKIKQFVANPTSGELNEIINELFTSDFIQFNVGSPNTYQSVIDLYSVVNQLIDWYHENDTLFSIDVQQVKKTSAYFPVINTLSTLCGSKS